MHPTRVSTACGVFVSMLLLSIGACGDRTVLRPLTAGDVVLAFGDSLTSGKGVSRNDSYPSVLESRLGIEVVNAGVSGELSEEGRARLPALLEEHHPALVVLVHGGNDIMRRMPHARLEEALREMVLLSRAAGADVVMLAVPGLNLSFSPPHVYEKVADDLSVPIDRSTLPELMRDRAMKSDRVHFNTAGYARMADAVLRLLATFGARVDAYAA